ncbi:MAG: glycoside hydrolase family 127 protein [Limisphaerales bacterium]
MTKTPATKLFSLRFCQWCAALVAFNTFAVPVTPVPDTVAGAVADQQDIQIPDRVQLRGWLGTRIAASLTNRLETLDTTLLLQGYRHRPGHQEWDGEHVGKWLHAASLAWAYSDDPVLRAKLDDTVAALCKCQLQDGYLGTYLDKDRWTSWDVWSHKYNLIGLITYMRYTGNLTPLPTCRRMADLLCQTFGDGPGQRDIIASGTHVGMAPTSVLEPMALLYRFTGEPKYLEFCKYILRSWEQPNGPHIVSRLLELKRVDKVGNAKAYEMLSCLNGALELYRTTGDRQLLDACRNAWQDIVDHRLYITGGASAQEHFQNDYVLPNDMASHICETCVTVTWMQVNLQLLRLTGESKFADQLEKTTDNHLLAAQNPRGDDWCYYTALEGRKPYDKFITCCHSSGPRGIALLPSFAITTDADGVVINLFDAGSAQLTLRDGTPVTLKMESRYPADGRIRVTIDTPEPKDFSIKVRVPAWCRQSSIRPSGAKLKGDGYTVLRRKWKNGDTMEVNLALEPRIVFGDHSNQGKAAILYGPLVLAADDSLLAETHASLDDLVLPKPKPTALAVTPEAAPDNWRSWPGAEFFRIKAVNMLDRHTFTVPLVPFAESGWTGGHYQVWLHLEPSPPAQAKPRGSGNHEHPENSSADSPK